MSDPSVAALGTPLAPEEQARANFYALLARLYADAPDAALLHAIAAAPSLGVVTLMDQGESKAAGLPAAWDTLRAASSVMDADAAAQEYMEIFIGVGKSLVNPHASHWLTGFMMEKPLAEVRSTLAGLGLARRPEVTMVEDHVSALFETMRFLVAGHEGQPPFPLAEQKAFFSRHVSPWIDRFTEDLQSVPVCNYYGAVAQFTESFVALERDSFAID
jgi:TorA maturation chaperone TorD